MSDVRALRTALERLVDRLEHHYCFECEGGPLRNCVEWQQLKGALAALPTADDSAEDLALHGNGAVTGESWQPALVVAPKERPMLSLYRCTVCGTRWLLWAVHGGSNWNLLDKYSHPGACCNNELMGAQIEHLRDFDLQAVPSAPPEKRVRELAQDGAFRAHCDDRFDDEHQGDFSTCPHPDCILTRDPAALPASLPGGATPEKEKEMNK